MNHEEIMRGFCNVLDSCETRSRAELHAQHITMLERLCRHAWETTPFYKERLKPLFDADGAFRLEAWNDVPPLTRGELLEEFETLRSTDVPKNFGGLLIAETSGSTGQPVRTLWTDTQQIATQCVIRRFDQWNASKPDGLMVTISARPISSGPTEFEDEYWAPVYKALNQPGRHININAQLPTDHLWKRLEEIKPQHLKIRPQQLLAIANIYLSRNSRPSFELATLRVYGEPRSKSVDDVFAKVFGTRSLSNYSAEEVGHVALECPDCGRFHVVDEVTHVDVVDDANQPVGYGDIGRILTTSLYSYAMPLIRYELGDDVMLGKPDCHRSQSVSLTEVTGRRADLFHHPDGGLFRPTAQVLTKTSYLLGAAAIQIVQREPKRFLVRYQTDDVPGIDALKGAVLQIQAAFGFRADVSLERVTEIPAMANGKRKVFVSEVQDPA